MLAQRPNGIEALQAFRLHLAHLAARGANQMDLHALLGVKRQRAAHSEGFVIRMRQHHQQFFILCCIHLFVL